MLFSQIQIHNFLTFKGTNTLEFPDPELTDHALLLVLAANTAGKTSIIRALRFLFCDDPLNHPNELDKLINDGAAAEASANDTVNGWVQVKVYSSKGLRTIRRRIETRCTAPGFLKVKNKVLEEERHGRSGDSFVTDEGEIQRALSLMVPPELFDYFFFEGEELAARLVGGKSSHGIRDGLATLIQDHQWGEAVDSVRDIARKIENELKRLAGDNLEYQEMLHKLEFNNNLVTNLNQEKIALDKKCDEAELIYSNCETDIQQLSKGKSFEQLSKDLDLVRSGFSRAGKQIDDSDKEIGRMIGISRGLPFYADGFDAAMRQLEVMQKENLLPADVSEGFVNRILRWPETQACICGRPLDPGANADQRKCIEDYREKTMAVDLNHALVSLLNSLEAETKNGFKARAKNSISEIDQSLQSRDKAVLAQKDYQEKIAGLEGRRQDLSVEEIQRLQKEQRAANETRLQCVEKLKTNDIALRNLGLMQTKLDAEIRALNRGGVAGQITKLIGTQKTASELADFIEEARTAVKNAFHSKLQDLVSQYYDPVAPDNSKAHVDKNSLLPAIRVDGEVRRNIGGAQRQLLVLSHIISLSRLRKWLHEELTKIGIIPGKIDDHCFVLDSVFGQVADQFREKCADFLVGKARQVIVLVASQQWDETVRSRLENAANKVYCLVRCTGKDDLKPEERTMSFRKKDIEVFRRIKPSEKPYTVAEEIPI